MVGILIPLFPFSNLNNFKSSNLLPKVSRLWVCLETPVSRRVDHDNRDFSPGHSDAGFENSLSHGRLTTTTILPNTTPIKTLTTFLMFDISCRRCLSLTTTTSFFFFLEMFPLPVSLFVCPSSVLCSVSTFSKEGGRGTSEGDHGIWKLCLYSTIVPSLH